MPISLDKHHPLEVYAACDPSLGFDMGSIMMLNSQDHCGLGDDGTQHCLFLRKGKTGNEARLRMGGAENRGRISVGDLKRVAQLYPGTLVQHNTAKELQQWKGGPKTVPGYVKDWMVEPNPVDIMPMQSHDGSSQGSIQICYEPSEHADTDTDGQYTQFESGSQASGQPGTDTDGQYTPFESGSHPSNSESEGHRAHPESEGHATTTEFESESQRTSFESEGHNSDGRSGHSSGAAYN